jgi:hypothetical protein
MDNFMPLAVARGAQPAEFVVTPSSLTKIEVPASEEVKLVQRTILK